jgi:DNA-binding PadR family transcriptional regulator
MARSFRTNPLALAVLACLYERPMHPYEIAQTLRMRAKHESVKLNYGSLYSVVEGLETRGFITAQETVRDGRRPERTIYAIGDAGARELIDWLSDLLATPLKEFPQFQAALSFLPVLPPEEAVERLKERCFVLEVELNRLRSMMAAATEAGLPRLFELETEYETGMREAELDFCRRLVKEIETGQLDGLEMWRSFTPGEDNYTFTLPES